LGLLVLFGLLGLCYCVDPSFVLNQNPIIPGVDFLGWGFDARDMRRDTFYSLRTPLFNWTYGEHNPTGAPLQYKYPIDVVTRKYPDQVLVRTVSRTYSDVYKFTSTEQMRRTIDLRLNVKASVKQFSGEITATYNYVSAEQINDYVYLNTVQMEFWQLLLAKRQMYSYVTDAMNELRSEGTYALNNDSYVQFMEMFGTHFIDSAMVGGAIELETNVHIDNATTAQQFAAAISGQFQSSTGSTNISGQITVNLDDSTQSLLTQTTSRSRILGANPKFTDFALNPNDPESTKEVFLSWKNTLLDNPVVTRYRLQEIWTLCTDPDVRKQLCIAIGTELGFLPDEDPNHCSDHVLVTGGSMKPGLSVYPDT